jgi:hypothetical protein
MTFEDKTEIDVNEKDLHLIHLMKRLIPFFTHNKLRNVICTVKLACLVSRASALLHETRAL